MAQGIQDFGMIPSGAAINPVEQRPVDENIQEEAVKAKQTEKDRLSSQASFLAVDESEAAQALRAIIESKLMERIEKVLEQDDQASALLGVLKEMKDKRNMAGIATKKLMNR